MLNVKNDITGIFKEVNVIMVKCQIRELRVIKLKDYVLLKNLNKLTCKLMGIGGLKCKGQNMS